MPYRTINRNLYRNISRHLPEHRYQEGECVSEVYIVTLSYDVYFEDPRFL